MLVRSADSTLASTNFFPFLDNPSWESRRTGARRRIGESEIVEVTGSERNCAKFTIIYTNHNEREYT